MKDIIDEMQLPLVNPKEELESISTQKFLPLFDLKKFEIRPEPYRDKGIDHTIEVKKHEKHTNFRTIIQLKATESIKKNNDGSYSLQVYTYNIQYLLNGGIPAYYVLYIKEEDKFHFENLNSFVSHLNEKDTNWQKQKTHVLRFNNELDKSGIDDIYKETYRVGLFNRNIREKLVYKNATLDSGDRIHFDYDLNVTSDSEIREIIENIGLQLINEGRWNDVLLLHSKASTKVAKSALYNLVLGLANYYKANHFETLNFFKQALHLKHELSKELLNHLQFFNSTVRFGLGLIGGDEYDEIINSLKSDDNLALYIKLEEAKNRYISKVEGESYDTLMSDFQNIIEDGRATDNIILTVRSEKVLYSGSKNNMEYLRSVSIINSLEVEMGPLLKLRIDSANRMIEDQKAWLEEVKNLKKETLEKKNYFVFYLTTLNEVKVMYEYEVYTDHVEVEAKIQGYEVPQKPDNRPIFSQMILRLDQACSFYNEIGHFENRSAAQSTKYEILHYIKEYDKAKELLNHLYDMAEINEMRDFKKKLDILANGGTIHERLEDMISEMVERSDFEKEEWSKMIKEMEEMDLGDKEFRLDDRTEYNTIHLFPIGHFQFPERDKDEVLEILNATEDAINQIKNLWNLEIIPVANIYNEEISEEGPQNGTLADSGLSSRRNIYRIRKEFKRKGFPRVIINM